MLMKRNLKEEKHPGNPNPLKQLLVTLESMLN